MPFEYWIDHEHRLVMMKSHGTLTIDDVFGYQREAWSCPNVAEYNELVDLSEVQDIDVLSIDQIRDLAKLDPGMDADSPGSKLAIIARTDTAFGLGRRYETYRNPESQGVRQVGVFRSPDDALAFLGVEA